jgi:hypothetical protein
MELRPFQAYIVDRALEHDADGQLVWPVVISTVARQMGKSYLARAVCLWRLHEGRELFGKEQTVLHVANKRETALEVMRPAGLWAERQYGKRAVKWGNTSAGIWLPDGDRWLIHAANESAGVGYSIDMAFLDEAWRIKSTVYEDAISPTMAAMPSPQGWLVSTAGSLSESQLLLSYRQRAIDRLGSDDPGDVLLLEWSAPPDADPDDVETWKWASPEWDDRREKFLHQRWSSGDPQAWRTQFLNQWITKADTWLDDGTWQATTDLDLELPADAVWQVAVEADFDGMGHAVAVVAPVGELLVCRVSFHRSIADVDVRLGELRASHPALTVTATPTYRDRLRTPFEMVGQREAVPATQAILEAFQRRLLRHDGDPALHEHLIASTVSKRQAGWVLSAPQGVQGVYGARALMFAVWAASKTPKPAPLIHVRRTG